MKRLVIFTVIFACIITLSGCGSVESKPDTELQISAAAEDYPVNYADNVTKKLSETEIRQLVSRALKIVVCIQDGDKNTAFDEMLVDKAAEEFDTDLDRSEYWEDIVSEKWVKDFTVSSDPGDIVKASQADADEAASFPDRSYDIGFDTKCDKGTAFVVFTAIRLDSGEYFIKIKNVYLLND